MIQYCNYDIKGTLSTTGTISSGGVVSAPGGNSTQWNTSYDNMITGLAVTGTTTKTLTATQQDGGTITASWTDEVGSNNYLTGLSFGTSDGILTASRSGLSSVTVDLDGRYLELGGGTMSGNIAMGNNSITNIAQLKANGDIQLLTSTGEYALYGATNAQTMLYHNGVKKFETASNGVSIIGNIDLTPSSSDISMIDNSGAALEIKQGSDLYMRFITTNGGEHIEVNKNIELAGMTATSGTFSSTITANNGQIVLGGTGRIQGVDTVSSGTDAANKTYVDNAVGGVSSGVTSVATTNGITGGTITSTGTIQVDSTVVRTTGTQTISGEKTFTTRINVDTSSGNEAMALYTENNTSPIADSFSGNTSKAYIYFTTVAGSNDPGYIMHESSSTETNEGVLHLVPSDDNATNDYVSIHGTNDADILKLHTSGLIETVNLQLQLKSGSGSIYLNDGVSIEGDLSVSGGDIILGGTGRIQGVDTVSSSTDAANKAYVDASVPTVNNATITIDAGTNLTTGGSFTTNQSFDETITINMATGGVGAGTYGSTSNSTKIDNITVDAYGRVTGVTTGGTGQVNTVSTGNANTIQITGTTGVTVTANTGTVSSSSSNLATGAQIQTAINSAVTGVLKYQGTWNANTNSPSLSSGSGTPGYYYIVSTSGSTNLDGITDWKVGDWAVFSDQATDAWQKIDNTQVGNVTGSGQSGRVAFWNSSSNITSNSAFTYDGNNLAIGGSMTWSGGSSTESNLAYDRSITSFGDSGTSTVTLTIGRQDGNSLSTSFNVPQGTMSSWQLTADSGGVATISNNDTVDISGSTYITTARSGDNVSITHDATSRSDASVTAAPAAGADFTVIDVLSTNSTGHVTYVRTKTVTMPVDNNDNNYLSSASWNTGNGILTLNRSGLSAVTVDLDGRYFIKNSNNSYYLNLTQNPVGTTYGNGVSAAPSYYFGQIAGDSDAMKFYAESASSNDITAVWEINDDLETGLTWLFRNKKTYSPYTATDAMKIDGDGDVTIGKDLTITGGDIILSGTGRIQGVDTVSSNTDAANKLYVDNAIAGVPQGDVTGVGAGDGLTGTSLSGPVPTLNVGAGTGMTINANDIAVTAAQTGITSIYNTSLVIGGASSVNAISFEASKIAFKSSNTQVANMDSTKFYPVTTNTIALGSATKKWSSVYATTFLGDLNGTINTATTGVTQSQGNNSTKIATTAYVDSYDSGVQTINEGDGIKKSGTASNVTISANYDSGDSDNLIAAATAVTSINGATSGYAAYVLTAESNPGLASGPVNKIRVSDIHLDDFGAAEANINLNSNKITNLSTPTASTDAATKAYVDANAGTGTVTGTGVSNRIAFWTNTSSIASDQELSYNLSLNRLLSGNYLIPNNGDYLGTDTSSSIRTLLTLDSSNNVEISNQALSTGSDTNIYFGDSFRIKDGSSTRLLIQSNGNMSNLGNTFNSGPINLEEDNKIIFDDDGDQWNYIQATSGEMEMGVGQTLTLKNIEEDLFGEIKIQGIYSIVESGNITTSNATYIPVFKDSASSSTPRRLYNQTPAKFIENNGIVKGAPATSGRVAVWTGSGTTNTVGSDTLYWNSSSNVLGVNYSGSTYNNGAVQIQGPTQNSGGIGLQIYNSTTGAPYGAHGIFVNAPRYGNAGISVKNPNVGSTFMRFYNNSGSSVGTITQSGSSSTSYNTSSDYRLKENIEPMSGSIERIKALKPCKFNFINEEVNEKGIKNKVDGFLAHEAAGVVPEAVTGQKDELDYEGNPEYQSIDQSKLVPLLTSALQEALAKIESLETRLNTLEQK